MAFPEPGEYRIAEQRARVIDQLQSQSLAFLIGAGKSSGTNQEGRPDVAVGCGAVRLGQNVSRR